VRGTAPVIGLTGGIGSGKSLVASRLQALGASVVDSDEISRALTSAGGEAMPALRAAFGARFVTAEGALDRDAMRALVFADDTARARLESILHPAIRSRSDRDLAAASGPYAIVVVPLLFESRGYLDRVGRVAVVDCPEALQVARTVARSGLAEAEVRAVMAAQWPRWRRLQSADDVVWNGGTIEEVVAQCEKLHLSYCERAHASATIAAIPRRGP
jgi:dephospho-CoA kinase